MPRDIDYFYERDLDRTNIVDFYNSLPGHLRKIFEASLSVSIINGNVLQGYRGPASHRNGGSGDSEALDSSYGIQEIRFWWGMRKDINWVPVAGQILFSVGRLTQAATGQLKWSSLYFDMADGKAVSYADALVIRQKNEEAKVAYDKGLEFFERKKFKAAQKCFEDAYQLCSKGYSKESTYKACRDATRIAVEAQNLVCDESFEHAAKKFQKAYDVSDNAMMDEILTCCKDDAKESAFRASCLMEMENESASNASYAADGE